MAEQEWWTTWLTGAVYAPLLCLCSDESVRYGNA